MARLSQQHCSPVNKSDTVLNEDQIESHLIELNNLWQTDNKNTSISREFKFKNYYETIAFINAVAWIVHEQDHHPEMNIGYNRCLITFSTHSISGLSVNDFICAAKINEINNR